MGPYNTAALLVNEEGDAGSTAQNVVRSFLGPAVCESCGGRSLPALSNAVRILSRNVERRSNHALEQNSELDLEPCMADWWERNGIQGREAFLRASLQAEELPITSWLHLADHVLQSLKTLLRR